MRMTTILFTLGAAALAVPAAAQLGLPGVSLPQLPPILDGPLGRTLENVDEGLANPERLLELRTERLEQLVRRNPQSVELDARGEPARRGKLLLLEPSPTALAAARQAGFAVGDPEELASLDLSIARLTLPAGVSLIDGEALFRRIAPDVEIVPDHLHFQSGGGGGLPVLTSGSAAAARPIATPVGVIDGAPGATLGITAVRGFAVGAPTASHHGSAMVSLLQGAGARNVRVADVYGTDRTGGSALALVRALDWLVGGGAKVVSVSLSGPQNAAVGRAIAGAQRSGVVVVAAVGNDGPAAPPSYPASYPGVLAVTAIDGRGRVLIEAGRAAHLDYAAPGADILARNAHGQWSKVRGTSYAVPLVAARTAAALVGGSNWRVALDREAEDLGVSGPDPQFGRGLLCRVCARRARKNHPAMD